MSLAAMARVQPGDLLLTRSANGLGARLIRLGAALEDKPNLVNHVAIVHHIDAAGTLWAIEGRPGGVGWRDAMPYMRSPWTLANAGQPKTPEQRKAVCDGAQALLGTPYDWDAIAADALEACHIDLKALWHPSFGGTVPGHVVCSSLAAYIYAKAGLAHPDGGRSVSPADWEKLIVTNRWE